MLGTAGTELTVDKDFEVIFVNLATAAVGGLAVIAAGLALSDTTQSRARHQRVRTPEHRTIHKQCVHVLVHLACGIG